jgi:hypothetical protein
MYIFYEWLKKRRCSKKYTDKAFGDTYQRKIMSHIKAYIKRLSDTARLNKLTAGDVPRGKMIPKIPAFLSKEEMSLLMKRLELTLANARIGGNKHEIYSAYLWRAVIWMLYTA